MRSMKFDYLPSSPPEPDDVAHLECENAALRDRVAELEAFLGGLHDDLSAHIREDENNLPCVLLDISELSAILKR